MPYYPGTEMTFRARFDLIPTVPQIYFTLYPLITLQVADLLFYDFILSNPPVVYTVLTNGDLSFLGVSGYQRYHEWYNSFYPLIP